MFNDFESSLNNVLVDTFNNILKFEEISLRDMAYGPVTIGEAHMIEIVGRQGGHTTVSEIAGLMNIALPTATVAVKKLERKGFVTKLPCSDDGRRNIITLTDSGRRIDKAHQLFHRKMVRNISRDFADSEKEILLVAIKKLDSFFKQKVEA